MKIHLNRAGQSLGQFTPEEVRAGFKDGKFIATDLAWRDGMPMWKPLVEVIDEIAPDTGAVESGSMPPVPVAAQAFPWEQRAQLGFFNAWLETIRMVLLEPAKTFRALPPAGGLGAPLFFYVLCATIGAIAGLVYQVALNSLGPAMNGTPSQRAMAEALGSTAVLGATIMFLPFLFAAIAFISSGLTHLALMIVGGAKKSFEATFRVMCYSVGSTSLLQLLPFCGALAASIWNIVLMVVGLSEVHGISKGRALVAVLLPVIVCCGVAVAAGFVLAAMVGGAFQGAAK